MTKPNKYAGLDAAQKGGDKFLVMTPAEWKTYFQQTNARTLKKVQGALRRGPDTPEWSRVKKLFAEALQEKQQEL